MNRHLRLLAAGAALFGVVGAAHADSESLMFLDSGPMGRYDTRLWGINVNDVNAGWLKFGIGSPTATEYLLCTELTQGIAPRGDFKNYDVFNKNGEIGWLLNQYSDVMSSDINDKAERASGLQLAIWEKKYDGDSSHNLDSGLFKVRDADNSIGVKGLQYADYYLNAAKGNKMDYVLYHSDKYQDMVGANPVPEPATFAALGAGLLLLRRRKRKAA